MTANVDELVAGETVGDLVAALRGLKFARLRSGMARLSGEIGPPVIRALMRLEAALLLADADELAASPTTDLRTPEQRRADAFVRLGEELAHAAGIELPDRSGSRGARAAAGRPDHRRRRSAGRLGDSSGLGETEGDSRVTKA
jgi:hypothetical protein